MNRLFCCKLREFPCSSGNGKSKARQIDTAAPEKTLWADLNCEESIQSETVATILDHAVVCEDSNDKHIHLELYLRLGQTASAYYKRDKLAFQTMFSK